MNEPLCRALIRAGLSVEDVAARLEVDPKTVGRWLEGRLPYRRYRWALAALLGAGDADLWPQLRGQGTRPGDVVGVYPHRAGVPAGVWFDVLGSARREIGILEAGGPFLPRASRIAQALSDRAAAGVRVRACLPDTRVRAPRPAPAAGTLSWYAPLRRHDSVEVRLHRDQCYGDLCFADERMLAGQSAFGVPGDRCPVLVLERREDEGLFTVYREAFERAWSASRDAG